jgi:hypothetical protein
MSESEGISFLKKACYGVCAFVSFLAMLLVIISVGTTHWILSTFTIQDVISNVSIDASIGFFQFCYASAVNGTCINLPTPISTPPGLLILGLIILAFNIIVSSVLAFIKLPPSITFVPVVLLFLSSIFIIAGYSTSWYYLFAYIKTTLPATLTLYNIDLPLTAIASLVQGLTVGYSYNLSVAGHFFTYVALAIAAYMSGQARIK